MNYTAAQKQAVEDFGSDILVSAGAGSGKTAVLTERIVRAVIDGRCDIDGILVVTFTRAAAAEMRRRIRSGLYEAFRRNRTDKRLAQQINKIDSAQISTFHAFCLNVIRQYYFAAGIDPAFSLLSETEIEYMQSEACEKLFELYYDEGDAAFASLENTYADLNDNKVFKSLIRSAYARSRRMAPAFDGDENKALAAAADAFAVGGKEEFFASPAVCAAEEMCRRALTRAGECLSKAAALGCEYDDKAHKWSAFTGDDMAVFSALQTHIDEGLPVFLRALKDFKLHAFSIRAACDAREEIKALRDAAKNYIREIQEALPFSADEYYRFTAESAANMKKLAEAAARFGQIYAAAKNERRSADFADLEQWCLRILADKDCRGAVREKYSYVFVDEYQDTNPMQEAVLTRAARPDCFFAVGDMKQSIYRFNDAEPALFLSRYDAAAKGEGKLIVMAENFRSQRPVIEGINSLFSRIMFRESGGIDYAAGEALKAEIDTPLAYKPEIHALPDKCRVIDGKVYASPVEYEAAYVVRLVKKLLTEDIYDRRTESVRRLRPEDIAILGRSMNAAAEIYARALAAEHIPAGAPDSSSFYDNIEIALMMNILRLTDNFRDDIALLAVMHSYIYAFTPDELLTVRLFRPEDTYCHEAVKHYAAEAEDGPLKTKLRAFIGDIESFAAASLHRSLAELVRQIFAVTGIYRLSGALPDGQTRRDNLRKLADMAASFEKRTFKGLYSFIAFAQSARDSGVFKAAAAGGGGVRIMTVHKAKGLEFGAVIVTGCSRSFSAGSKRDIPVRFDRELGLCPVYRNIDESYSAQTLQGTAAALREKHANAAEEMRILYVAATRAEARLIFTGIVSDNQYNEFSSGMKPGSLYFAGNFMQLLLSGTSGSDKWLTVRPPCEEEPTADEVKDAEPEKTPAAPRGKVSACRGRIALSEAVAAEVKRLINWRYPYEKDLAVPSKLTVSALKTRELAPVNGKVIALSENPFTDTHEKITPAEAGTLTHSFLQRLSLPALAAAGDIAAQLQIQLQNMEKQGFFRDAEAAAVDTDAIAAFLTSAPGKALLAADSVRREMPFIMQITPGEADESWREASGSIVLQGIIDCVFTGGGRKYLIDYKTDGFYGEERFLASHRSYIKQIELYDKALRALDGSGADERYICYLRMRRYEKV